MKTLLLIRHAKSSHDDPKVTDHDRPLNERGGREAPQIGEHLARRDLVPELLLCSTARRARETAERLAATSGYASPIDVRRELYLASPDEFVRALRAVAGDPRRVAIVAHNPGLEEYAYRLSGEFVTVATSTVVRIELDVANWAELLPGTRGRLVDVWRPKDDA